jgi:hypothetical protein
MLRSVVWFLFPTRRALRWIHSRYCVCGSLCRGEAVAEALAPEPIFICSWVDFGSRSRFHFTARFQSPPPVLIRSTISCHPSFDSAQVLPFDLVAVATSEILIFPLSDLFPGLRFGSRSSSPVSCFPSPLGSVPRCPADESVFCSSCVSQAPPKFFVLTAFWFVGLCVGTRLILAVWTWVVPARFCSWVFDFSRCHQAQLDSFVLRVLFVWGSSTGVTLSSSLIPLARGMCAWGRLQCPCYEVVSEINSLLELLFMDSLLDLISWWLYCSSWRISDFSAFGLI